MIKTARAVFYLITIYFYLGCTAQSTMVNYYNYDMPKIEVINLCKTILLNLDYEIDIYAPETNVIATKSKKLKKLLIGYNYIVYIKVTDKVEVYLASERNIFMRGSESSIGGGELTTMDPNMPYSVQKLIFNTIRREFERKNIKRIELN
jgi:hypothetical protein